MKGYPLKAFLSDYTAIADWKWWRKLTDTNRNRTAGWAHMWLNVAVLAFSTVNFAIRLFYAETIILPIGLILSLVVAALLMASGWYGGELTFRHKVGIVGPDETTLS